ncbi:MAG: cytochrome-c peroxidase [Bacteroidota bacterium]
MNIITSTSLLFCLIMFIGCKSDTGPTASSKPASFLPPKDFPAMEFPNDNPYSAEKAELGRYLFFDKRFSRDTSVACGTCHRPEFAFADSGNVFSKGFHGLPGVRNSPSLTNTGYNTSYFWDGTVLTLEKQAIAPIINPVEMNMDTDTLIIRLKNESQYRSLFTSAWGTPEITLERITRSLATFQRTLVSGSSPFDDWNRGNNDAISASAKRGYELFFGEKGDCFHCHASYNFTDNMFHNNGTELFPADEGRYRLTNNAADKGKFRTPTLRNIAKTSPYMHDGKFTTLVQVLAHYNMGGKNSETKDILMRPLGLTEQDQTDIIEFLRSLSDHKFTNNASLQDPWKK